MARGGGGGGIALGRTETQLKNGERREKDSCFYGNVGNHLFPPVGEGKSEGRLEHGARLVFLLIYSFEIGPSKPAGL